MLIRTLQLTVKNLVHTNNDTVIVDATLHALTITMISYRGNQANMPGYNEVPKYPSYSSKPAHEVQSKSVLTLMTDSTNYNK